MLEILAIAGLVFGTLAYFLLVRRRASVRSGLWTMSRALAASNEIALQRLHLKPPERPPESGEGDWREGIVAKDRRSGKDRRSADHRRFGRGRRSGGDRRRS
jgi:hypothetical protein